MKRAGLDYWQYVEVLIHDSWEDFVGTVEADERLYFIETDGTSLYHQIAYQSKDYLVFGSETTGIPPAVMQFYADQHVSIPMKQGRSLNLANTASIVVFEAWRQHDFQW